MTNSSDSNKLGPKKPQEKSPEYMRKAYLYTGILLVLAVIGGAILAGLIIGAEERDTGQLDEIQERLEDREAIPAE